MARNNFFIFNKTYLSIFYSNHHQSVNGFNRQSVKIQCTSDIIAPCLLTWSVNFIVYYILFFITAAGWQKAGREDPYQQPKHLREAAMDTIDCSMC